MSAVRLDVWLWAARFYKTRTLCKHAIDEGQVRVDGEPVKPSKSVTVGLRIRIKRGQDICEVAVLAVSDQRRGAAEAQQLYAETTASIEKRKQLKLAHLSGDGLMCDARPSKKFRRAVIHFKRSLGIED